ncbi:MAG: LPS assembly lipoprotein LptE [Pseudomonadota bacterium]
MWSSDRSARRLLLAAGGAALLAGCGFELRKPPQMAFRAVLLQGFDARSPMAEELRRSLASVTQVVTNPADAQVVLESLADTRERSVVASTAAGQVRELQLRVRFRFRVITPSGRELLPPDELVQSRDMSYNETNALAKEHEESQLYRAMQSDIVAQVMRRLSAAKP